MAIIKPNNNTLSSITALPAAISTGKVLQVQSLYTANQQTTTSTSFFDVTGMSKSIIPSSTSNKVLVNICFYAAAIPSSKPYFRLMRDSTNLATISQDSICLLYTSPSPRDGLLSRMPSSA